MASYAIVTQMIAYIGKGASMRFNVHLLEHVFMIHFGFELE
jgi:hypothetical protein